MWKRDFCDRIIPTLNVLLGKLSYMHCFSLVVSCPVPPLPQLWVTLSTIPSTPGLAQLEPNPYTLGANWLA